ncbi:MAG: DUF2877 domain-containing protein [Gudongella sp.]|nr:DUF2877 domain-containing protein [Gudongella sp.]
MSFSKIKALSWDRNFKDFTYKSKGRMDICIHSIFKRVINISSAEKILYTISNISTDNAPYTMKIDFSGNFNETIVKEDRIIIGDESIIIGNLKIELSEVDLWSPIGKKSTDYSISNIENNIKLFNSLIIENGENGGCKDYYLKNFLNINGHMQSPIEEELSKRIEIFYKSLLANSLNKEHVKNLIGLGIGLTPSGDDFLTGFLASIYKFEKNNEIHSRISQFVYPLLYSTTDISAAMLKAAIEGKYRETLHGFIHSFLESDNDSFIKSFKNMLSIGSSSGTDLSIGVVLALQYTLNNQ